MKPITAAFCSLLLLALTGCAHDIYGAVSKLNRSEPVGSPYSHYLALEYQDLANHSRWKTADYFARKGLAAVDGVAVEPETLSEDQLRSEDGAELAEARAALVTFLNNGGRDIAPDKAAVAQSHFDCWSLDAAPVEENGASCKETFYTAMAALKETVAATSPPPSAMAYAPVPANTAAPSEDFPAPVTDNGKGALVPLDQAAFLVFFDWDKHNISQGADDVLKTAAQDISARTDVHAVRVVGHTDTSGRESYNQSLSLKRANATKTALIQHGIPVDKIRVEGRGETDPLVKTPDNIREPQNRRAQITLE